MPRIITVQRTIQRHPDDVARSVRKGLRQLLGGGQPAGDGSFVTAVSTRAASLHVDSHLRVICGVSPTDGSDLAIPVKWRAERYRRLFPVFVGKLEVSPADGATRVVLAGSYKRPFGPLGVIADVLGLHVVTERTARQLLRRLVTGIHEETRHPAPPSPDGGRLRVRDLMTPDPLLLEADLPLRSAAVLLHDLNLSGAPVVNDSGELIGVLSQRDLLDKLLVPAIAARDPRAIRRWFARSVEEACSMPARTTSPDTFVADAATEMFRNDIARLVVIDGSRIVGLISRRDLLAALDRSDRAILRAVEDILGGVEGAGLDARVDWGVVTLEGRLAERSMIARLVEQVRMIGGVIEVEPAVDYDHEDELDLRVVEAPPANASF